MLRWVCQVAMKSGPFQDVPDLPTGSFPVCLTDAPSLQREHPLWSQIETQRDKLDSPFALFAQVSGRMHGCDLKRLFMAVRFNDE